MSEKTYPEIGGLIPHASTHEPGGSDEVFGIPAAPHAASHISGGDLLPDATALTRGLMTPAYAGKVNAQFYIDPNTVHVDGNRVDAYTQDGSPTFPFKTIQAGVTHAQTMCSASNPVMVLVEPGIYDENVVITKEGCHLRGRGTPYNCIIMPTTGSGITFTNASLISLALYNVTGVYSDLVNGGSAGPLQSGVWGISVSSPVGNASPPVRLLGVKGDASPTTTNFAFGLYLEHCAIITANPVAPPLYIRNANTAVIDVESYILGTAPITVVNCNKVNFSNSWIEGDLSVTWNSADANGTPAHTTSKYVYGKNTRVNNVAISGEAKLDDVYSWDIKLDAILSGTSTFTGYETLVRRNLTIGAGCAFNFYASGILNDLTINIGALACRMDGGDLMGTTTDPGSHLTRNITKHQSAHVTGNDQIPDASAITRGLMTPAMVGVLGTVPGHLHTGLDGTGKLSQANTHQSADTDVGVASLHHTIGVGAFQAAAGNHDHTNFVKTDGTRGLTATGSQAGAGTVSTVGSSTLVTTAGNAFASLNEWDTITANGQTRQIYVKNDNNNVIVNEDVDWSASFAWTWNQALHLHFQTDANDRTERGLTWSNAVGDTTWQLYTWVNEGDEFLGFYNAMSGFDTLLMSEAGRFSINRTSDSFPRVATDQVPNLFSIFPQHYTYVFYTEDNAAFADNTAQAGKSLGVPFTFLNGSIADRTKNWTYMAMARKWQTCWLDFRTPGVAGWTTRFEYWKTGVGWTPVVLTSDGTSNYTQIGAVAWNKKNPGGTGDDWGVTSVAGTDDLYWVRVGSLTVPPAPDTPMTQSISPNAIPRFAVYQCANDTTPNLFIDPLGRISLGGSELVGNNLFQVTARTLTGTINSSETEALAGFYSADPERKAIQNQLADNSSAYPVFGLANSRGTLVIPTTLLNGDTLGGLEFKGYTNTWVEAGEIKCEIDGVPGVGGDLPTRLVFMTTPSGGGGYVERLRIAADGLVSTVGTIQAGIFKGTTFETDVAAAKLSISGTTISGAGTDAAVNVTLAPKGAGTIVASSKRITSLADPLAAQDAATQNFVTTGFATIGHTHATLPTVGEKANLPYINYIKANGFVANPSYVDNGDGTLTIASAQCWLSPDGSFTPTALYTLAGVTTGSGGMPAIPIGQTCYVVGDYNGGLPKFNLLLATDVELITEQAVIPYITLFRENATKIHKLEWDAMGVDLVNKLHQRFVKTERFARENGLILADSGSRNLTITSGKAWNGGTRVSLNPFDSTVDNFSMFYHVAGVWTELVTTQYSNSQYDDGTNIQGLLPGKFVVNWIYRDQGVTAEAHILLSNQYDSISAARLAPIPTTVPPLIQAHGFLVGAVIVEQGQPAGEVRSAWVTSFTLGTVLVHNELTGLNAGNYQHLTPTQVTYLPTSDQKNALAGTSGTAPSSTNKFVDDADPRNTNTRVAVDHSHSGAAGQSSKLVQANTHESPDTDSATTSLHHTIGTGATQAAKGSHNHDGTGTNGSKLTQANSHESPDTDSATTALHHTLGTGANQAAAGNHNHTGTYALLAHGHTGGADGSILNQTSTHGSADTDTATTAIHHTLGNGANQSAAGSHTHSGAAGMGSKLVQANTHESADTDSATSAIHHTLGTGANQAAAGNHGHTGLYTDITHTHDATGNNGPQLAQANTHQSPDTDTATTALHHTLGTGANQAAAGNHDHSSVKLSQANTHQSADTDSATTALHHTLGTGANQAAAGNHNHTGTYPPVAHTHDGTGNNGPQLTQANTHQSPDTDAATTSLHHTLGTGANQAAAGNHTHTGYVDTSTNQTVGGNKTFTGQTILSTQGITLSNGNNDAVAISNGTFIRITGPTANYVIRGIAGGVDGRHITLYNTVAFRLTLNNDDAGETTAANRILTMTGGNIQTTTQGCFNLVYDGTSSRWIVTSWQA